MSKNRQPLGNGLKRDSERDDININLNKWGSAMSGFQKMSIEFKRLFYIRSE